MHKTMDTLHYKWITGYALDDENGDKCRYIDEFVGTESEYEKHIRTLDRGAYGHMLVRKEQISTAKATKK